VVLSSHRGPCVCPMLSDCDLPGFAVIDTRSQLPTSLQHTDDTPRLLRAHAAADRPGRHRLSARSLRPTMER
jgi:hypothetical protein